MEDWGRELTAAKLGKAGNDLGGGGEVWRGTKSDDSIDTVLCRHVIGYYGRAKKECCTLPIAPTGEERMNLISQISLGHGGIADRTE